MDVAHVVLSGIVVAMGGAMIGKYITTKELKDKLSIIEKKLELKMDSFVPSIFCKTKHDALSVLMEEKFHNIGSKLDGLIHKIDKMNMK